MLLNLVWLERLVIFSKEVSPSEAFPYLEERLEDLQTSNVLKL